MCSAMLWKAEMLLELQPQTTWFLTWAELLCNCTKCRCNLVFHFIGRGAHHQHIISIVSVFFSQCPLHYSAMSSCGRSKSQMAALWGNVLSDLWICRASLLPLALHVLHKRVGSEVAAKLSGWQREWSCDWCGKAERSSPILSIKRLGWECDAV